jgi:uncharacterized membrane protein
MTSSSDLDDVARYAAAVRAALADLPAQERTDLLEDLEDHLNEVASESDVPLTQRLGSPEQYAAELRSAYGVRAGERPRRYQGVLAALRRTATYRAVADFLPLIRPAWWILRGYLAVLVLTAVFQTGRNGFNSLRLIPSPLTSSGLLQVVATVVAIWISIAIGRRRLALSRGWRSAALLANGLVALAALPALLSMSASLGSPYYFSSSGPGYAVYEPQNRPPGCVTLLGPVTNIYAYSKDGKPLQDVLLYDQNGQPVVVQCPEGRGFAGRGQVTVRYPTGADGQPIMNAYPLTETGADGSMVPAPRVAIPPFPTATSPSPSPTP